jgi:shikimate dehydrogenase
MKRLAVIGNPISHSLSPAMHNAALNFLGINSKYVAINLKENCFEDFISKAKKRVFRF